MQKGVGMGKKAFILVVVIVTCFCILASCSVKRYNATIYNAVEKSFRKEFLAYNITRGCIYGSDREVITEAESYNAPEYYIYIAKTREHAEEFFYEFPFDTDFDKQMLIIHIFTSTCARQYEIKKISCRHGKLHINVGTEKMPFGINDGVPPYQRVLVIQLDRLDFDTVVINKL